MEMSIDQKVAELQAICRTCESGKVAMRIILLIMKMLNIEDDIIDSILGFCDRTKQKWIDRYNENSVSGLADLSRSGRPCLLTEEEESELKDIVKLSTEKESKEKIISAKQIEEKIKNNYNVQYSSSGLYNMLSRIGLSKLLPRPVHEKNDPKVMSEWLEELPKKIKEIESQNQDKKIEIYFEDETRYGQKTIYTGIWGLRGSYIEYENQNGFLNSWIYGAVNPKSGKHHGLILPSLNAESMQIFLNEFSKQIPSNEHIIMILDGSKAHNNKTICIPENISFIFLPPYSPKLNPIERLWLFIKSHYLAFKKYKTMDEIIAEGVDAWLKTTDEIVRSVCACHYLPNA